jgi:hypothetical protein
VDQRQSPNADAFNYRRYVEELDTAVHVWAATQSFMAEGEPLALDVNRVPYVVLAVGVTVSPDEVDSFRFTQIARWLYQRVQQTIIRLGAEQGALWIRRWPEIDWRPPFVPAPEWGDEPAEGMLCSTIRLSRKDGQPISDDGLGMRIKPEGAPIWRDEKLRDQYA